MVEDVPRGSAAEGAGLRRGDIILAWSPGSAFTALNSPFDWDELEASGTAGDTLLLRGTKSGAEAVWNLKSGVSGVVVGPVVSPGFSPPYQECRELLSAGKTADSSRCFSLLASRIPKSDPSWLVVWLLYRAGRLAALAHQWNEMDRAYGDAMDRVQGLDTRVAERLTASWLSFTEQHFQEDLAARQRSSPRSVEVAKAYDNLAGLSTLKGDLPGAERNLREALAIREVLMPDSSGVAENLIQLGDVLRLRGDLVQATDCFSRALKIEERVAPDTEPVVLILSELGGMAAIRGDLDGAERDYGRAMTIAEKIDSDGPSVATVLSGLGSIATIRRDLAKAQELLAHALAIREKRLAADSLPIAQILDQLGEVLLMRGDAVRAEEYLQRAVRIERKLGLATPDLAVTLAALGDAASSRGDYASAENYYTQALQLRQRLTPNSLTVAMSLYQLGDVLQHRGDWTHSAERYEQALAIDLKLTPNGPATAATLFRLGAVYSTLGDPTKGEGYFKQALAIQNALAPGDLSAAMRSQSLGVLNTYRTGSEETSKYIESALAVYEKMAPGNKSIEQQRLYLLGIEALQRDSFSMAEDYLQKAVAISEKLTPGGLDTAGSYNFLALVERGKGDRAKAEQYLQRALTIEEKLAPVSVNLAVTLGNLGLLAVERGNLDMANVYFSGTLAICEKLMPGNSYHANMLHAMGVISRQRGEIDLANQYFARAVGMLDTLTARLGGSEESRASFRSEREEYYQDYMDTLLVLKQPEEAFHVVERGRARSLLAMLAERDLIFRDLPPELDRLRKQNAASYDRTYNDLSHSNPKTDPAAVERLQSRLREINAEREQITERIRQASPRIAELQYPQPLDLAATRKILDPGTALLSYQIAGAKTTLFVVRPTGENPGLSVFTIPVQQDALRKQIDEFRRLILDRKTAGDSLFASKSRQLYDLLIKPAEPAVLTSTRLLVIPDGSLNALPFAALLRSRTQYFVEWKPLHIAVSATVYAQLKKSRSRRDKPLDVVAFGDPLYPSGGSKGQPQRDADIDVQSATERGLSLAPLLFSRAEVDGVTSLFPDRSRKYLGADATEERAKSLGTNVRYVHFAVHGILDDRLPLNSALALAIPERVVPGQDNGLLQAWEIFERVRLDADLVTLSACNTGLGQEMNGEGLIGLTRAFQYAGAHSIIASLWAVDDLRTMELMKQLYSGLRNGTAKDEALRAAQLHVLRSAPSSAPYYWAAFSLIGDWR
jgi:CHAT domain-containing protein/Tfp pilus assembly protein PilF